MCALVSQLCLTLCDRTDCSPPGFSVHGILQTRILEWVSMPFSRGHPGFPGGCDGKASACNAGDPGLISESGQSPGEGNGNPLQHSCLENSMDGGAWWTTVHGVAKRWTRQSNFTSSPEELPNPRIKPWSPASQAGSLPFELQLLKLRE